MACLACPIGPGCRGEKHRRLCARLAEPDVRSHLLARAGMLADAPAPAPRPSRPARELVVARFNEDVRWCEDAPAGVSVVVYNKGLDDHLLGGRARVVPLANRGREGRTWLGHILRHYDDLADLTFFAQGEPHQPAAEFLGRLALDYPDTTGLTREYLPHFPPAWIKATDEVADRDGFSVRYGRAIHQGGRRPEQNEAWLREVWGRFFAVPIPEPLSDWTYAYGAMYAVPRRRIRDRPREFWAWCHDVIARPEHQAEHTWGSGYAFELLWRYLFGPADRYPVVPGPPAGSTLPPVATRVGSLVRAVVKHASAGFPLAEAAERERRASICAACPLLAPPDTCSKCGCRLSAKRAMATERCPVGNW